MQATVAEFSAVDGDDGALGSLFAGIEERCMAAGVDTIRALAVPGTADYSHLRQAGFLPRRAAFTLQYVPFERSLEHFTRIGDWQFQGGDFDVV